MPLLKLLAPLRCIAVLASILALAGLPQVALAGETPLNPFTTYPTELRFVSFDKHSAQLKVRSRASESQSAYPFYFPARQSVTSWPIFIDATSDRPVYNMKREFRFQETYEGIPQALDHLPPEVAKAKFRRAMKAGADGDTRYPVSALKTFTLIRMPRDAAEMSISNHLQWTEDYLKDKTKSNSYFSSVNSCMILTYTLEPEAKKRYTNYFDIRITFEREILADGTVDAYLLAQADPTYTCNFGDFKSAEATRLYEAVKLLEQKEGGASERR